MAKQPYYHLTKIGSEVTLRGDRMGWHFLVPPFFCHLYQQAVDKSYLLKALGLGVKTPPGDRVEVTGSAYKAHYPVFLFLSPNDFLGFLGTTKKVDI